MSSPRLRPVWLSLALVASCGAPVEPGTSDFESVSQAGSPSTMSPPVLLTGTVVTPDTIIKNGQVLVSGGLIACVGTGTACTSQAQTLGAKTVATGGIIAPGMIDTHNHILFDIFDGSDWLPSKVYQDHTQWPSEPRYQAMLDVKQCLENASQGKPTWCAQTPYGTAAGSVECEMDKFGELKGLVAGTTSIVGLPGEAPKCFSSLTRSIDTAQNGLGSDKIRTSALFPPSKSTGDSTCAAMASGAANAFLIHVGEGVDAKALKEFSTLGSLTTKPDCLYAPQTTITHGVAFTSNEFGIMAAHGMKLTWSPASNVALYDATANIPAALKAGVTVALAPDWSMGGSQNLLDELRFADAWDNAHWNNRLQPKDLVDMVTVNAAEVVGMSDRLGQIKQGYIADLFVVSGSASNPYGAILAATPHEVELVMVGGQVLYGDVAYESVAPGLPGCETVSICAKNKFLCVATATTTDKLNQTYAQIQSALQEALVTADKQTPSDGWNFAPLTPLVTCK